MSQLIHRSSLSRAISASLVALSCASTGASASVLEEVFVTSQKRIENIQDIGLSVSAFSGDQMDALGMVNTTDIIQQVPGLQLQSFTPAFTAFNLRGISQNNFQDNLEAPVAVYINDAYVGSMNAINGQLFDMERVEVLRGPQGTLFGRNATGGLIHYATNIASSDNLNGYVKGSLGSFDRKSIEGAVGGGLADGIRGRLAARWEEADGYIENKVGQRDQQGADGYVVRGALQFDIGDTIVADLIASYSEDSDVPTGVYVIQDADVTDLGLATPTSAPSPDPHEDFSDGGYFERESTSITGKLSWEISDTLQLVSITNSLEMDKFYLEDADGTPSAVTGAIFDFSTEAEYSQWSQEIRLSGDHDDFRWSTGLFYLDIEGDYQSIADGNVITPTYNTAVTSTTLDSTNWSIFGQMEYDFDYNWTAIVGYRWSQDDKDIDMLTTDDSRNPDGSDDGLGPVAQVQDISGVNTIDYGDYAARLQLNYTSEADDLYFVSYNRGIKGGNWSPNRSVTVEDFKHDEEVLHAYEIGSKLTLKDGVARINTTLFYYDYQDYQQFSLLNATPQVVNRDATNRGGEVELFITPNESWDIVLGLSVIDSEVDGAPTALGIDHEDVELPNAPEFSANALVRYNWEAMGGEFTAQVDGAYTGEQYLEGTNNPSSKEDGYFVGNANVTYTTEDGAWKYSAWVKNFTDEEYRLYHLDLAILDVFIGDGFGFTQEVYAPPRTFGITATYNFGD
ncbi:TonB-dependent receptor [Dasania sp. GY-MA-18]|uniref:TonB-dependent receptor n=1 Tax=Dasania phycosphaerae TaxID=2950436 RepID=A0A9J6RIF1_9GAMM|nr:MULTISPECIES: TonB-dependent receptor [Dasania]MCR8921612.1 TonB-dependent receptor [Dasania sp. GY-MA-18]MCZ0864040.1 TonB-dependent receptor [Dasania phycosphaerae]MCZ0867768.1 TonB-dependent receptor [Dasania phycosphaerae]